MEKQRRLTEFSFGNATKSNPMPRTEGINSSSGSSINQTNEIVKVKRISNRSVKSFEVLKSFACDRLTQIATIPFVFVAVDNDNDNDNEKGKWNKSKRN
jgi:hypothetical protein